MFYEFDNDANNKEENEIFMEFIDKLSIKNENGEEKIDDVNDNNNDKNDLFETLFEKTLENKNTFFFLWKDKRISLSNILDNINENSQKNLVKLKNSFLFIKNKIDFLLQSLKEKLASVPYIIKCICKIIFLLIKNKFNSSDNYIHNSFIGKFIFENCILASLNLEDNNLIENRIYNSKTKHYLKIISDILSKAVNYKLFKEEKTPNQILLNYYFIEIIPTLNDINNKLTEIRLPNFLNFLIEKKIQNYDLKNDYKYEYFQENIRKFV